MENQKNNITSPFFHHYDTPHPLHTNRHFARDPLVCPYALSAKGGRSLMKGKFYILLGLIYQGEHSFCLFWFGKLGLCAWQYSTTTQRTKRLQNSFCLPKHPDVDWLCQDVH